jgi:hypothetical protein
MIADRLVIEALADDLARCEEARRQLVTVIADLADEVLIWRAFGEREYHRRLTAERARDRALERLNRRQDVAA